MKRSASLFLGVVFMCCQIGLGEEKELRIRQYDLRIVPNFRTKVIELTATIDVENPALRNSFDFGLSDQYDSVNVTCSSSSVSTERANGWISVNVNRPSRKLRLSFVLKGKLGRSNDENREIIADSSLFLLWSDRFYPIDFDRWAAVRIELLLPAGFQAIAPGRLTKTEGSAGANRYIFESNIPTVNFSVFADSRWIKTERNVHGIPMQTLLYPQSQKFAEQIFGTSSEILGFFSSIMCPYPFERFSFVTIDSTYARRAFPGFVGYEPRYLEKEFTTTGHDAHETSLLWWGYTAHGSGPGNFQWTEGLGDYVEILYDEAYRKPIPKIFERFRAEYLALPADQDVPYTELRGNTPQKIVHGKYPWLMHLIRYAVGDSAFVRGLRLVFQRFRHNTFSMDQFISAMEEGCGQSLRWWREEWLGRRGVPDIAFSSQVEKNGTRYQVTCTVEQHGNLYHIPVELGIESRGGLRIEKVNLSKQRETFHFESIAVPTRIVLDPGRLVLMKLSSGASHAVERGQTAD